MQGFWIGSIGNEALQFADGNIFYRAGRGVHHILLFQLLVGAAYCEVVIATVLIPFQQFELLVKDLIVVHFGIQYFTVVVFHSQCEVGA